MDPGIGSEGRYRIPARRIALAVQYDGTGFNGWQRQKGGRTVQAEMENALGVLTREKIKTTASGRTDTGVHALMQVVHFDTFSAIGLQRLCMGLNGILARDVSVTNAYDVPPGFSARFSVVEREYQYFILNAPLRSPFMMNRAMWVQQPLDAAYIRDASSFLIGEKDFASFCKKSDAEDKNTVRSISRISVDRFENIIRLTITGTAFLHNMIRIIVGTIVEMCLKGEPAAGLADILEKKDRDSSGITAPPYGLYLSRVSYDPDLGSMPSAF